MMNTHAAHTVIKALEHIELLSQTPEGLDELNSSRLGLCSTVVQVLCAQHSAASDSELHEYESAYDLWKETHLGLFEEWPEFSGQLFYPIRVASFKHPRDDHEFLDTAFEQFNSSGIMFGINDYGMARLRLTAYLRECYEKMVAV